MLLACAALFLRSPFSGSTSLLQQINHQNPGLVMKCYGFARVWKASITWKKNEVSAQPGKISTAALSEASHPLDQLLVKLAKPQNPEVHFWSVPKSHVYTWNLELHGSWIAIYHRSGETNYAQILASAWSLLILTEAEIEIQATH